MPNTYTQLHIHIVFSVRNRLNIITDKYREEIHKYISGIVQNKKCKMILINSMPDHIHILLGLNPDISLSDLIRDIKKSSTVFINEKKFITGKFNWQEGFSAFTVSHSHIKNVCNYIKNQHIHHKKKTFAEEYLELLRNAEIDYDEKYVF